MKLICPQCKGDLDLKVFSKKKNKIKEGKYICRKCDKEYPIINFVPRFVESEKYVSSFGKEWNIYKSVKNRRPEMSEEEMKNFLGLTKKDIEGRIVLEIGCGAGPYLNICARRFNAKHVVGIDLSKAVEAAYENVGELDNVTIIQADLFSLPFKENSFDVVFSLGVLHHTPNPRMAFKTISKYVKRNGVLSIWVYGYYWKRKIDSKEWLRKNIFSKLTTDQIRLFSKFAAYVLYYLYLVPIIGDGLRERFPIGMDKDREVRELNTFDIYSPTFVSHHYLDEVYSWFKEEGFKEIEPTRYILGMKGVKF